MENGFTKAIISNNFIEVIQQSIPPLVNKSRSGGRKHTTSSNLEHYEANQKVIINRARKEIRRLLECNFNKKYAFITLTFRSSSIFNINDLDECYKSFCDFKKRLSYYLKKNKLIPFKYIGVTEFQGKKRNGAIHYHLICNLIDVSKEVLEEIWQHGWVQKSIVYSNPTDNEKISYYLKKGIDDQRLTGRKKYYRSKGLKKPVIMTFDNPSDFYESLINLEPTSLSSNTYHSPLYGDILYQTFYIKNKEL